jgi:hypothetical protein
MAKPKFSKEQREAIRLTAAIRLKLIEHDPTVQGNALALAVVMWLDGLGDKKAGMFRLFIMVVLARLTNDPRLTKHLRVLAGDAARSEAILAKSKTAR